MILDPQYENGLCDLDGFSHLILLYHFHLSSGYNLKVKPFLDTIERGLFSTRAPRRPNSIGLSIVRLDRIDGCTLHVLDVDMVGPDPFAGHQALCPRLRYPQRCACRVAGAMSEHVNVPQVGPAIQGLRKKGRTDGTGKIKRIPRSLHAGEKKSMPLPYTFNRMEFAGSLGDLGTVLPLAIGMIMVNGLGPRRASSFPWACSTFLPASTLASRRRFSP